MNLIIGYGNTLRGDDGVGPGIALQLAQEFPEWAVLMPHQLMPELAESLSHADRAVFIDASIEGETGDVSCAVLTGMDDGSLFTHHVSPEALLAGAEALYGHAPQAWLVTITGQNFEYGEGLSPEVAYAVPEVCCLVQKLLIGACQGA
jgi:hydrogenase maturation protease